jgi:hypothetical protein
MQSHVSGLFGLIFVLGAGVILVGSAALAHPIRESQQTPDSGEALTDQGPQGSDEAPTGQTQPAAEVDELVAQQGQPSVAPDGPTSGQPLADQLFVGAPRQTGRSVGQVSRPMYNQPLPLGYPNGQAEHLRQAAEAETNPNVPRPTTILNAPNP